MNLPRSRTSSPPRSDDPDQRDTDDKPAPEPGATAATDESTNNHSPTSQNRSGIDEIKQVALSFGLSIAIVPLIGLVLNFTPFGIRPAPVAASVSGFTLISAVVAAKRRNELPSDERFQVPYREWVKAARSEFLESESRTDAALSGLLAVSVLLAVGSVGYAVAVPQEREYVADQAERASRRTDWFVAPLTRECGV